MFRKQAAAERGRELQGLWVSHKTIGTAKKRKPKVGQERNTYENNRQKKESNQSHVEKGPAQRKKKCLKIENRGLGKRKGHGERKSSGRSAPCGEAKREKKGKNGRPPPTRQKSRQKKIPGLEGGQKPEIGKRSHKQSIGWRARRVGQKSKNVEGRGKNPSGTLQKKSPPARKGKRGEANQTFRHLEAWENWGKTKGGHRKKNWGDRKRKGE